MSILRGITPDQIQAYRREMSKLWREFTWLQGGEAYNGTIWSLRRKLYNLKAHHFK